MHALLNVALRAARAGAEHCLRGLDRLDRLAIIDPDPAAFLTGMDREADQIILSRLRKSFPGHGFESRVSGADDADSGNIVWLVDPLLGNRNFAAGYGRFGVSVACRVDGVISHGVVIVPLLNEEYTASRGNGAQLNSRRIRVSDRAELESALLGLDPKRLPASRFIDLQRLLMEAGVEPRLGGCGALDMVETAAARLQGGYCALTDPSSLAAARLILEQAGGLSSGVDGNPEVARDDEIVYGNPGMLRTLVRLRRSLSPKPASTPR